MAKYLSRPRAKYDVLVASPEGVAERWSAQYQDGRWPDKDPITKSLRELPLTATADQIAKIIGNKSWTHPTCCSCIRAVEIAAEFNGGSSPAVICADCLKDALCVLSSQNCPVKSE